MHPRQHRILFVLGILLVAAWPSTGQAPLIVNGAWVREPVTGRTQTAAYAVLENATGAEIGIVSASSPAAGTVELHEMVRSADMMRMQQVKRIAVPGSGKTELRPGGYHLMLFDLKKPLKEGDTVTIEFVADTGAKIQVTAPVKKGGMPR